MVSLRVLKLRWLRWLAERGMFERVARSRWRSQRLAILCYHGVSQRDEHLWNDELYVPPELLDSRMSVLRREGCHVCSLDEGLRHLRDGTLPPRAVAVTFDDGIVDFARVAWPLLARHGYPGVVYLSSYYSAVQLPVFGPYCSYLLWHGRDRGSFDGRPLGLARDYRLSDPAERGLAVSDLRDRCRALGLCAPRRHELAVALADRLGVDADGFLAQRLFHLMTRDEVAAVSAQGAAVELHTHRHRLPFEKAAFLRELAENQAYIEHCTSHRAEHFCYPSGEWRPELFGWLAEFGARSAVVGEKGYAAASTPPMGLPRFADTCGVTELEFRAWVTGAYQLTPRRRQRRPAA